jgi:hypothetical protein
MSIDTYEILTLILLLLAFFHFRKYNDEFLFLPILFFWSTGIERFNAVAEGKASWVAVNYTRQIFTTMTTEKAMVALGYFALGTLILYLSYVFHNRKVRYPTHYIDNPDLFSQFIQSNKTLILSLFVIFNLLYTVLLGFRSGPVTLGQSYILLFPMALGGLVLLAFLVYRSYNWKEHFSIKVLYMGLMVYAIWLSYNPSQRFQFLSWIIAIGILITQRMSFTRKALTYGGGAVLVLFLFSLAGVARKTNISSMTMEQMWEASQERSQKREDQNMLDGFMMVLDVYPHHLNYHYGMEHLEILTRPIPRQLWPGKPVGGYANKLGLNKIEKGTVGISQTLYGSFYGEGGVWGIIIFSILYGWLLVKLFRYTLRYDSDIRWLLKGIIIASFIPLLRGGDLPGIIAFIGMSYWPVFLILYRYNKFLKQVNR